MLSNPPDPLVARTPAGRISVIIPCYNHAQYLPDALAGALQQTRAASEIIVVDDGSTDNTAQVAASFGDRLRYLYQPNAGLSAARNTGIQHATGDYLGFLDADDVWQPEFLSVLGAMLDQEPELAAVYGGSQFIDSKGRPLWQSITKTYPPENMHAVLVGGVFFPPCAILLRRAVFDAVGLFDTELSAAEDWDMWLRISDRHLIGGSHKILALYRQHGDNMTRDLTRMRNNQLKVARKHFGNEAGDPGAKTQDRQRAFAGVYFWQALGSYQQHDERAGLDAFRCAVAHSPQLLDSVDTLYMLACADQPPGYVGDPLTWNAEENPARVYAALDSIFADSTASALLKSKRKTSYALANFTLGMLAYSKRELGLARRFFFTAAKWQPGLMFNRRWQSYLIRSLLRVSLIRSWAESKRGLVLRSGFASSDSDH